MATSYVHPIARPHTSRAKFRPKLALAPGRPIPGAAGALTVDRPDGVGTPTDDESLEAPLPTSALVQEAVDTALDSLRALEHQARDVALRFRRRALADAQRGLTELVVSTQTLLKLAEMTATASGRDLEELCEGEGLSAPADTSAAVTALIREQLAQDWRSVAEVIERQLVAALAAWRLVFETLDPTPGPYGTAA